MADQASVWNFEIYEGKISSLVQLVEYYRHFGKDATADAWLWYGAIQKRMPSLMLYYGDYLMKRNQFRDRDMAKILYLRALNQAEQAGRWDFASVVREQLKALEADAKR